MSKELKFIDGDLAIVTNRHTLYSSIYSLEQMRHLSTSLAITKWLLKHRNPAMQEESMYN